MQKQMVSRDFLSAPFLLLRIIGFTNRHISAKIIKHRMNISPIFVINIFNFLILQLGFLNYLFHVQLYSSIPNIIFRFFVNYEKIRYLLLLKRQKLCQTRLRLNNVFPDNIKCHFEIEIRCKIKKFIWSQNGD